MNNLPKEVIEALERTTNLINEVVEFMNSIKVKLRKSRLYLALNVKINQQIMSVTGKVKNMLISFVNMVVGFINK